MKTGDLIRSAVSNTFRSRTRTILTILAIFVGAFTLTLTSGLGTGINAYIASTVSGVGASDAMTVTKTSTDSTGPQADAKPKEYDPEAVASGIPGQTVTALTPADITTITAIHGVVKAEPVRRITLDYVQVGSGTKYVASVGELVPGQTTVLAAGKKPEKSSRELQVALPDSYVAPLGFSRDSSALGATVRLAVTDAGRTQHVIQARVVGVTEKGLASPTGASVLTNDALSDALFAAQSTGLSAEQADRYASATVWFDPNASDTQIHALKGRLTSSGYTGTTISDQLGTITTVIDGIVLVLNAFAIIALLAAAFGIVNTLYMSVQERTREIGLMKALGMGSGRIFGLFSLEAAFLGFLGSAIGAVIAIGAGTAISSALSSSLLSGLPGLSLIAFNPASIASIILLVVAIAFLAGTLPAARAAKADPVESLRYE
ncbi:ABC transporter permease [Leifsonia sp. SIMBA_070]|uniref:ABC transporter permease n=1 Tax=Leifsonia sp. SIMBA_070 TaxID=3085810 RepID=UPI0039780C7F